MAREPLGSRTHTNSRGFSAPRRRQSPVDQRCFFFLFRTTFIYVFSSFSFCGGTRGEDMRLCHPLVDLTGLSTPWVIAPGTLHVSYFFFMTTPFLVYYSFFFFGLEDFCNTPPMDLFHYGIWWKSHVSFSKAVQGNMRATGTMRGARTLREIATEFIKNSPGLCTNGDASVLLPRLWDILKWKFRLIASKKLCRVAYRDVAHI